MAAGGIRRLLGARGQALDRLERFAGGLGRGRARRLGARRGSGSGRRSGAQLGELMAELCKPGASLIGALVLVTHRALERFELRVRLGQLAREGALFLDALAGDRLELGARVVELRAQLLLTLGLRLAALLTLSLVVGEPSGELVDPDAHLLQGFAQRPVALAPAGD